MLRTMPPAAAATPRAITYTVTGNRQLIDFVTVIYTDQQGALRTEVNVALPWSKTVVLDPGVELKSVTATSVGGRLNCAITDAAGAAEAVLSAARVTADKAAARARLRTGSLGSFMGLGGRETGARSQRGGRCGR